jgi:hypothetical protein
MAYQKRIPIELLGYDLLKKMVDHGVYPFRMTAEYKGVVSTLFVYTIDDEGRYFGTSHKSQETLDYVESVLNPKPVEPKSDIVPSYTFELKFNPFR